MVVEIEAEFGVELGGSFLGDAPDTLLPLSLQDLIDATVKALAAESADRDLMREDIAARVDEAKSMPTLAEAKEALCREMVSRFLGWKLPQDFYPDCFVSFDRERASTGVGNWPIGTNLLTAPQAMQMFMHCIEGLAILPPIPVRLPLELDGDEPTQAVAPQSNLT